MRTRFFLACFSLLILPLNGSAQTGPIIPEQQKISLKEAVAILSGCDCFVKSIQAPLSVEEHKLVVSFGVLKKLDFKTLDSLYRGSDEIISLYAFGLITSNFSDSLSDQHLEILENKHKVGIYQKGTEDFPKERISEIALEMHADMEKRKQEQIQKDRIEEIIKHFIATYALFPESYIPISFTGYYPYTVHAADPEKEEFSQAHFIVHSYKLKTIKGDVVTASHIFKFNADFVIMLIEAAESTTTSCWPPKLDVWFNEFGRTLAETDKKNLQLGAN